MTWNGGVYTVGQFLEMAQVSPDGFAEGVLAASDEELEAALRRRGRQELLLAEARARGLSPTDAQTDSVAAEARAAVRDRADAIGLIPRPDGGAGAADTIGTGATTAEERVRAALIRVVSGQQEILPLGGVTFLLRETGSWRIHESRIGATVSRIEELEAR